MNHAGEGHTARTRDGRFDAPLVRALDVAEIGAFAWDLGAGTLTCSTWLERLWGYLPGEFDGRASTWLQRVHPDDVRPFEQAIAVGQRERGPVDVDIRIRRPDEDRWVAVRGQIDDADGGGVLHGVVRDVTDVRREAGARDAAAAALTAAQALAHLGHWAVDLRTGQPTWSDEMARLFYQPPGRPAPAVADFLALVHPDDREWLGRAIREAPATTGVQTLSHRTDPGLGPVRHLAVAMQVTHDAAGAPVRIHGTALDVSERARSVETATRLAAIVSSTSDAVVAKTLDGTITSWNHGAEQIFGYAAAEMLGASVFRLVPDELESEERGILAALARGEQVRNLETRRRAKDGRLVEVSLSSAPIRDERGRIVGASKIVRDITASKARARELARMNRLYAALSHVNQAIVWARHETELFQSVCDTLVIHGGVTTAWIGVRDPATERLVLAAEHGDTHGFARGIEIYCDGRASSRGLTTRAFHGAAPTVCNDLAADPEIAAHAAVWARAAVRSAAIFPIRQDGAVIGLLSVYAREVGFFAAEEMALLAEAAGDVSFALDNLARERARAAATASSARERAFSDALLHSMPGVLYLFDEAGRFLRWNPNLEAATGRSADAIARLHPTELIAEPDRPAVVAAIAQTFAAGHAAVEAELLHVDGSRRPFLFRGRRVEFDGQPCLVGVGVDIADQRRAVQVQRELTEILEQRVTERTLELRAAVARAEAADRVKSAFLATMSHELRTPMNSILGFSGILLQGLAGPLTDEQAKQLGMVRASARHLLELINDILDLSKIEANQLAIRRGPLDLRAAIERSVGSVRPLAEKKGLELIAVIDPAVGVIVSDGRRVEQILLNLLNNAIKFTDAGQVVLTAGLDGDRVVTRVRDTGIGIRPEDLPTLFQPFRQLDSGLARAHEGTGLGLAICQRLAELLGGEIAATSTWGAGSEFAVWLPRGEAS